MRDMAEPYALPEELVETGRDVMRFVREGGSIMVNGRTHLVFAILLEQACRRRHDEMALTLASSWTRLQRAGGSPAGMANVPFDVLLARIGGDIRPEELTDWILTHPAVLTPAFDASLADAPPLRDVCELFQRCRQVPAAIAVRERATGRMFVPDHLRPLLARARDLLDEADDDPGPLVEVLVRVLADPAFIQLHPKASLGVHRHLAEALRRSVELRPDENLIGLAVDVTAKAVRLAPADPEVFTQRGNALSDLYQWTREEKLLDRIVSAYDRALRLTPRDADEWPSRANDLAAALRDRHRRRPDPAGLDRAIGLLEQAREHRPLFRVNLAAVLAERYAYRVDHGEAADRADLDAAIEICRSVSAEEPDRHTRTHAGVELATALLRRHDDIGGPADAAEAYEVAMRTADGLPRGGVARPHLLVMAGGAARRLFLSSRDPARLTEMLEALAAAAEESPGNAAFAGGLLAELVQALSMTGESDAARLRRALQPLARVAGLRPGDETAAFVLAHVTGLTAAAEGDLGSLGDAIGTLETLHIVPDVHGALTGLYLRRFAITGDSADLDAAEGHARALEPGDLRTEALLHCRLAGFRRAPDWESLRSALAVCAGLRSAEAFDRGVGQLVSALSEGTPTDLLRRLIAEVEGYPDRDRYARLRYGVRHLCFKIDGAVEDLSAAIGLLRSLPSGPERDGLLCGFLRDRFVALGRHDDLAEAVRYGERAVAESDTPEVGGGPRFLALSNLAAAYRARYTVGGDMADLDRAVAVYERLTAIPWLREHPEPTVFNNAANALRTRFEATGRAEDLDRVFELHERALEALPPGDPARARQNHNLGNAYLSRVARLGDEAALEHALAHHRAAAADPAAEPGLRAMARLAVAQDLLVRHRARRDEAALREALGLVAEALPGLPERSWNWFAAHLHAAALHEAWHGLSGDDEDLSRAIEAYRVCCAPDCPVEIRHSAIGGWARWASDRDAWQEALEPYRAALGLLADLLKTQLAVRHKHAWLGRMGALAARAAYALARTGDLAEAVEAVEAGRAVVLGELMDLTRAGLPERLSAAARTWWMLASAEPDAVEAGAVEAGDGHAELAAARAELDAAIAEARRAIGDPSFLAPPSFAEIAGRARDPLVYLIVTDWGGYALTVTDRPEVIPIPLPGLTLDALERALSGVSASARPFDDVSGPLRELAMGAVLDALPAGTRRLTLVPVGPLELMPWQVAVVDEVTLRFTPSARSLRGVAAEGGAAGPGDVRDAFRLLAVTGSPLPGAADEAASVAEWFRDSTVLLNATSDQVLRELPRHSVWHFACHAYADEERPLDSSLVLAGGTRITLRRLLELPAGAVRLAVLSACRTNETGSHLPDEVITLASGMLQAGMTGVVASRWPVGDLAAAMLMIRFYDAWLNEGEEPVSALRVAQRWMRDTSNGEKTAYFAPSRSPRTRRLWRRLVRLDPAERSFASPAHWGAFVYVGA